VSDVEATLGFVAGTHYCSPFRTHPSAVLPRTAVLLTSSRIGNLKRVQDFRPVCSHRVGIERDGRLHGLSGKALKMVGTMSRKAPAVS